MSSAATSKIKVPKTNKQTLSEWQNGCIFEKNQTTLVLSQRTDQIRKLKLS
jgi:hypothetical protein